VVVVTGATAPVGKVANAGVLVAPVTPTPSPS